MPEFLSNFVRSLSATQADRLWEWLDENPDAIDDLIAVAADRADELGGP